VASGFSSGSKQLSRASVYFRCALLHRISFNSLHCSFAAQHKHLSPKLGHYFFGCPVYYYFITAFGIISATKPPSSSASKSRQLSVRLVLNDSGRHKLKK
jgi:hypothetical protein